MQFGTKWGPQTIAKLVQITPITMVYGIYNYSFHGVYKPIYNVWGHHIVPIHIWDSYFHNIWDVILPIDFHMFKDG